MFPCVELNEFVIQLDEEVEGMQSTILTLQQQLKCAKNELVEEKQNGEKNTEQIRILERNLDLARTQPPSPVEGVKMRGEEDYQMTDRTDVGHEGKESGHEPMETECLKPGEDNMKIERNDVSCKAVELQLEYIQSDVETANGESEVANAHGLVENVSPAVENDKLDSQHADSVGNESVFYNTESARIGAGVSNNSSMEGVRTNMNNTATYREDPRTFVESAKVILTEEHNDLKKDEADKQNGRAERNGARIVENPRMNFEHGGRPMDHARTIMGHGRTSKENAKTNKEHAKNIVEHARNNTSDVIVAPVEKGSAFSVSLEPGQRRATGTPPCPTTFSISQILGEPKRTPSPDIQPGGDAVVTKIPYMGGGYTDSKKEAAFRTESPGYMNGEGKDGTPPLVT